MEIPEVENRQFDDAFGKGADEGTRATKERILSYISNIRNPDLVGHASQSNSWKLGYCRALLTMKKAMKDL